MITPSDFQKVLDTHLRRWPAMAPQDILKLAYQSVFGPGHMIPDAASCRAYLAEEWNTAKGERFWEPIGGGLARFHLGAPQPAEAEISLLSSLFIRTANMAHGSREELEAVLSTVSPALLPPDVLSQYQAQGCPAVHHSAAYNAAYAPHYRVVAQEYACYFPVLLAVSQALERQETVLISIDGQCGSGKSTLAAVLQDVFGGNLYHMDDFYLPFPQRQPGWRQLPAGNMDLARFHSEVLEPIRSGQTVSYRPWDCSSGDYAPARKILPAQLHIIEGSYSQHPTLCGTYTLKVFLTCSTEERLRRLKLREGDISGFLSTWIPLENLYHETYGIPSPSTITINTENLIF